MKDLLPSPAWSICDAMRHWPPATSSSASTPRPRTKIPSLVSLSAFILHRFIVPANDTRKTSGLQGAGRYSYGPTPQDGVLSRYLPSVGRGSLQVSHLPRTRHPSCLLPLSPRRCRPIPRSHLPESITSINATIPSFTPKSESKASQQRHQRRSPWQEPCGNARC